MSLENNDSKGLSATEKLMAVIFVLPPILAYGLGAVLYRAFTIATLWNWFVVPVFGLATLTAMSVVSLMLVWAVIKFQYGTSGVYLDGSLKDSIAYVTHPIWFNSISLLMGYALKFWLGI